MTYRPIPVPFDLAEIPRYLQAEFQRIANEWAAQMPQLSLQTLHAAPAKPRAGDIVVADGTDWNPGSGAGAYVYRGGAWHFLG